MGNVVIVTHWLDGDVIPFIRIGKKLRDMGYEVTLITHCYFEERAINEGFAFEALDTPEEYMNMVNDMHMIKFQGGDRNGSLEQGLLFHEKYECNEVRLREYEKIEKYCRRPNTIILCKNRSSIAAYLVAEKKHIPLISVLMNPNETVSMRLYDQMYGAKEIQSLNKLRTTLGLEPIKSWLQWECSAKVTLGLWPTWYAQEDAEWPARIINVGFPIEPSGEKISISAWPELSEWLKNNQNPIVITGGTTRLIDNDFYAKSISACGVLGKPTIVLCRYRDLLPKNLPGNVIWYEYLPLDEILPKMSLIIHHGGIGTLSGAMLAGVCQLILPCYVDRPLNATLVKNLGIGDFVSKVNWKTEKLAEKINELLMSDKSLKCKEIADKMKHNEGLTEAARIVEECLNNKEYVYEIRQDGLWEKNENEFFNEDAEKKRMLLKSFSNEQKALLIEKLKRKKKFG